MLEKENNISEIGLAENCLSLMLLRINVQATSLACLLQTLTLGKHPVVRFPKGAAQPAHNKKRRMKKKKERIPFNIMIKTKKMSMIKLWRKVGLLMLFLRFLNRIASGLTTQEASPKARCVKLHTKCRVLRKTAFLSASPLLKYHSSQRQT